MAYSGTHVENMVVMVDLNARARAIVTLEYSTRTSLGALDGDRLLLCAVHLAGVDITLLQYK